ncbi:hypothetical protein IB238_03635 [Rhizobium sp. ARZ01]|uniref:hypothetical protein n=1 Tax=Rhizobium sp. ARZ01 TaxID=2769313 RepID=UPI00177D97F1|nr:hypothetical protein [Rhizobium sp. ARZ01]MBD9371734.1 hypothetical protein [Rhizobium sp. ARZ01]
MTVKRAVTLAACLFTAGLFAAPAKAADYGNYAEVRPAYASPAQASVCADPGVLGFITRRFEYKAANYIRQNLSIYEIRRAQLTQFEPFNGYISSVQRQYCVADATLTDGSHRPLFYLIERPWGFAGMGRSIEFCIPGLDPWYVYGDDCASLRTPY